MQLTLTIFTFVESWAFTSVLWPGFTLACSIVQTWLIITWIDLRWKSNIYFFTILVFNPLGDRPTIISQLHISMVDCNKGLNFSIGLGGGRIHQPQKFSTISAQNWTDRGGSILVPRAVILLVGAKIRAKHSAGKKNRGSVDKNGLILSNLKSLSIKWRSI